MGKMPLCCILLKKKKVENVEVLITVKVQHAFSLMLPQHPKSDIANIRIPVPIKSAGANM